MAEGVEVAKDVVETTLSVPLGSMVSAAGATSSTSTPLHCIKRRSGLLPLTKISALLRSPALRTQLTPSLTVLAEQRLAQG